MMLIPATTVQANPTNLDIQVTPGVVFFGGAGGRTNEGRIQVDGLTTTAALNGGGRVELRRRHRQRSGDHADIVGRHGRDARSGGPVISIIPKTGGNSVKGSFYLSNVTVWMVGDNYTQELKDRGLTTPGKLYKLWDYNLGIGGPIMKDRIWFFFQFRDEGSHRTVPGMFANLNMGDADEMDLCPGHEPARGPGWQLAQRGAARDGAADAAQQVQRLLGPPDPVPGRRVSGHRGRMPPVGRGRDHLRRAPIHQSVRAPRRRRPRSARS